MNVEHIAIILDGNRRWAKSKRLLPYLGHKAGAENLETLAKDADKLGLKYLSVYVFSTENWERAKTEVNYLMKLFRVYFRKIRDSKDNNIKIKFFSSRDTLDEKYLKMIDETEKATQNKTGLQLNVCFNYGGRLEIVEAVKNIVKDVETGIISKDKITEELFSSYLYSKDIPDPEIIIRTSGEMRLSNFLIWQNSYSELFFISKNWPDFTIDDLKDVITEFEGRERRFGGK